MNASHLHYVVHGHRNATHAKVCIRGFARRNSISFRCVRSAVGDQDRYASLRQQHHRQRRPALRSISHNYTIVMIVSKTIAKAHSYSSLGCVCFFRIHYFERVRSFHHHRHHRHHQRHQRKNAHRHISTHIIQESANV